MEHRWGERFSIDVPVGLGVPFSAPAHGQLVNVSLSGAFIKTTLDVRVLSRLQVVFKGRRGLKDAPVVIAAYVARKGGDGIGVEWCEFAPPVVTDLIRTASNDKKQPPRGVSPGESSHWVAASSRPP